MGFTSIPIRNIIREAVARGGIIVDVRSILFPKANICWYTVLMG